jgi:NADH dehydrogenase FAD-containing subunit
MNNGVKKRWVVLGGGFDGLEFCKTFHHRFLSQHAKQITVCGGVL